ncbi:MAG: hypothetical protein ACAH21_12545 [Ramlibacter sp.]|nr:hypothetical protein [Ramlibacter sp.]
MVYMITTKGRAVLRSATMWGLSQHLRDLLALCDPAVRVDHARQFMPPESLQAALFSLQQLELIEGPPAQAPRAATWVTDAMGAGRRAHLREASSTLRA